MTTPQLKTPVQQNFESEIPQSIREEDLAAPIQTTTASVEPNTHTTTCTVSTGSRPPSSSGGVPSRLLTRLRGGSVSSSTATVPQDRDTLTENGVLVGATDVEPAPQQQHQPFQQQQQRSSRPSSISISGSFLGRLRTGSTSSALQPPPSPTVLVTETTRVTSVEILPTGANNNNNNNASSSSGSGNTASALGRRTPSPVGAAAAVEAPSRRSSTLPPFFTLPFGPSEPLTLGSVVASNDYAPITVPGADPDSSPPDFIEQLFQRVEAESERRAAAEEARERERERAAQGSRSASRPGTADPGAPRIGVNRRRGGSISVSRLGAPIDPSAAEGSVPATPSRLSTIILQNPLYQHHQANTSRDTISSTSSSHHAEEPTTHVTQITTIPARSRSATLSKVVGTAIGRRLSRARSTDILTVDNAGSDGIDIVVVGVSVQSAVQTVSVIVEPSPDERDELALHAPKEDAQGLKSAIVTATVVTAEVSAPGQLQPKLKLRRSQSKLSLLATKGWGTLTKRFKKKSGDLQTVPASSASPPTPAAVS